MAYQAYSKSGIMPFSGSFADQPAQIMEIFEVLMELDGEREEDMREKSQREQDRNGQRR